jgi:hypothetical protein
MTDPELTDRILRQGRALVRAIEALGTIEPTGPFERALARLLMAAYKRRLQAIVGTAPAWVSEETLGAGERIGDRRAVLRVSENRSFATAILTCVCAAPWETDFRIAMAGH